MCPQGHPCPKPPDPPLDDVRHGLDRAADRGRHEADITDQGAERVGGAQRQLRLHRRLRIRRRAADEVGRHPGTHGTPCVRGRRSRIGRALAAEAKEEIPRQRHHDRSQATRSAHQNRHLRRATRAPHIDVGDGMPGLRIHRADGRNTRRWVSITPVKASDK